MSKILVEYHAGLGKKNSDGTRNSPKPVHTFHNYPSLEKHFIQSKDIAWRGNYYVFYKNQFQLTVKMEELNSTQELRQIFNLKGNKIEDQYSSYINRSASWTESIDSYNKGPIAEIWDQATALYKFSTDNNISPSAKTLAIGAIAYLFMPVDAIPDVTPLIGLIDDAGVITLAFSQIYNEIRND